MIDYQLLKEKDKLERVVRSIETRRKNKLIRDPNKIKKEKVLKNSTINKYLSEYTFIHEIRKFDIIDVKKALNYQLTYEDTNKGICEADPSCRALPYRKQICYLHWILGKKKREENGQ